MLVIVSSTLSYEVLVITEISTWKMFFFNHCFLMNNIQYRWKFRVSLICPWSDFLEKHTWFIFISYLVKFYVDKTSNSGKGYLDFPNSSFRFPSSQGGRGGENADRLAHTHFVPTNSVDDALLHVTFHVTALSLSWDLISFQSNLSTVGFKETLFG